MNSLPSSSLDLDKQFKKSSEIKLLCELLSSALKHPMGRSSFWLETHWLSRWERTSRYHWHSCVMQVCLAGAEGPVRSRLILHVSFGGGALNVSDSLESEKLLKYSPKSLVAVLSSFSQSRLLDALRQWEFLLPVSRKPEKSKTVVASCGKWCSAGWTGKSSFCCIGPKKLQQGSSLRFVFVDLSVCAVTPRLGCRTRRWSSF